MADEEDMVECSLCGAQNPKGLVYCKECGVELELAEKEGEVEDLVVGLLDVKSKDDEEDKEMFDELLDSLLIEDEKKVDVKEFECPLCMTTVPMDATECPNCGAEFVEPEEKAAKPKPMPKITVKERVARAPAERAPEVKKRKPVKPKEKPAPKVELTEAELPKTHIYEGKIIDVTIIVTVVALVAIFLSFQMYIFANLNPGTLGVFFLVMFLGIFIVYFFFRISTSAVSQGDKLVKQGHYNEAIQMYDRGIRLGINPASAWTSKGVAYKRLEDYESALKCHNIALKLNPRNEIAWCNKGDVLFKKGDLQEALRCYDEAIDLKPKYAVAYNNKGATLAMAGKYKEARECHRKAIQLRPKYVAAWLNQGEVLVRLGKRKEAEICLKRAKALGAV